MTLRLPEVLPYDAVDEWIDSTVIFETDEWTDNDGVTWQTPIATLANRDISNFGRTFYSLLGDSPSREEDEDGYVQWQGSMTCMRWTAKELTEEEIDEILGPDE